ncbi:MAG TPA: hypothetical protein DHD79_05640 [Firmicutes bacterium]|jgi:hypothetical protein|nr:hypothetical protein [Bacillota bacterium]HAW69654.1 hypothetical protein [Bacillota bacterium]HAZ21640.1 hypothetical protein [Bacillota bacterium]HBE05317.1 hypothetical protein [Bacillota bacterium]HBG43334.1 hypothetical protein [Bacillota bacterium]
MLGTDKPVFAVLCRKTPAVLLKLTELSKMKRLLQKGRKENGSAESNYLVVCKLPYNMHWEGAA